MSTFEYACEIHGEFEAIQKIGDPPLENCPKCVEEKKESGPPKRLISLSSFSLKGGGWAADKYSR